VNKPKPSLIGPVRVLQEKELDEDGLEIADSGPTQYNSTGDEIRAQVRQRVPCRSIRRHAHSKLFHPSNPDAFGFVGRPLRVLLKFTYNTGMHPLNAS